MIDIKNILGKHYQHKYTGEIKKVIYAGDDRVILYDNSIYYPYFTADFSKFWKPYETHDDKTHDDKVLELPFKVGDKVWFIVDNEVHEGTLTECNITINKDDTQICYNVLYYSRIHYKVEAKGIASNKLFKTKKELLESL